MIRFALTIFVSAFLLFQVQPMIAKFILPWFGGSSLVWTTCLMFFQVLLVAGYAYSHLIHRLLSPKSQWILHSILLLAACLFLPIRPSDEWKPDGLGEPALEISLLLAATIGLPFFVLTTTSPLVQAWVAKTYPAKSPYRLYALSNIGSLLALLSYPFVIEPNLKLSHQSIVWSVGFVLFALSCFWSGWLFCRRSQNATKPDVAEQPAVSNPTEPVKYSTPVTIGRTLLWILLPMAASIMLVASTNLMTHEIASVPFMWVVPLSLYLLTFVICFDHPRWYIRPLVWPLMAASVVFGCFLILAGIESGAPVQFIGYSAISFLTAFACHGELAKMKPASSGLTFYFLMIGIGGALGGIFVAVIAPRIFNDFYEFHIGMLLTVILVFAAFLLQFASVPQSGSTKEIKQTNSGKKQAIPFLYYTLITALTASFLVGAVNHYQKEGDTEELIYKARNTYGLLSVNEYQNPTSRSLINGRIDHGTQYMTGPWETLPTSYYLEADYSEALGDYENWRYGSGSGLGVAFGYLDFNAPTDDGSLHIGIVGLGTGTISAYGREGDKIRFYEINSHVEDIAREYFTYLEKSECTDIEVVIGDARIQLENDEKKDIDKFDILVVDAFSSDAIPSHLLTLECFELYRQRLNEDGLLAVHISNRYLYLEPIVFNAAQKLGLLTTLVDDDESGSTWVIVSNNEDFHSALPVMTAATPFDDDMPDILWTDDFTSILPIVEYEFDFGEGFVWFWSSDDDEDEPEEEEEVEEPTPFTFTP